MGYLKTKIGLILNYDIIHFDFIIRFIHPTKLLIKYSSNFTFLNHPIDK